MTVNDQLHIDECENKLPEMEDKYVYDKLNDQDRKWIRAMRLKLEAIYAKMRVAEQRREGRVTDCC